MEGLKRFVQVEPELAEFLPAFCEAFSYPGILKVVMRWFDRGNLLGVEIMRDNGECVAMRLGDQSAQHFDPAIIMRYVVEEIEHLLGISSPCPKCGEPFNDLQVNMEACKVTYAPCGCVSEWNEESNDAATA